MYNYPLTITSGSLGLFPKVVAVDAGKRTALFIKTKAGPVRDGKEPYRVFADEKQERLLFQIQLNKPDKKTRLFEISIADGTKLGTVVPDEGRKWIIQNTSGISVGKITEKNGWRRDWAFLLGYLGFILIPIAPIQYEIELNEQKILLLQEKYDFLNSVDTLKQIGSCLEAEEQLLLASLMVIFWPV